MVLLSVVLDFVQEHRALGGPPSALRQATLLRTTVLRDGRPRELPITEVVPGDVVLLAAGESRAGRCRLLEVRATFSSTRR
jgi:Mg2+-importing ATPase